MPTCCGAHDESDDGNDDDQPDSDYHYGAGAADRPSLLKKLFGLAPGFRHDFGRYHFYGQGDAEGRYNQIIQVAKNRDEIGNQIDRAESIGGHQTQKGFGIPGDARVTGGQVEGIGFPFKGMRAAHQSVNQCAFS